MIKLPKNKLTKEELKKVFEIVENNSEVADAVDHELEQGGLWTEISYQIAKDFGIVNS